MLDEAVLNFSESTVHQLETAPERVMHPAVDEMDVGTSRITSYFSAIPDNAIELAVLERDVMAVCYSYTRFTCGFSLLLTTPTDVSYAIVPECQVTEGNVPHAFNSEKRALIGNLYACGLYTGPVSKYIRLEYIPATDN